MGRVLLLTAILRHKADGSIYHIVLARARRYRLVSTVLYCLRTLYKSSPDWRNLTGPHIFLIVRAIG